MNAPTVFAIAPFGFLVAEKSAVGAVETEASTAVYWFDKAELSDEQNLQMWLKWLSGFEELGEPLPLEEAISMQDTLMKQYLEE